MPHDNTALENEIARLRGLDLAGLQAGWRTVFGRRVPAHVPRHLLLRIIAYGLQAEVYGDLDPVSVRYLDRLARAGSDKSAPLPEASSVRPGTLLVREWDGAASRDGARPGLYLEWDLLPELVGGGPRHHRNALERTALLRPARGLAMKGVPGPCAAPYTPGSRSL